MASYSPDGVREFLHRGSGRPPGRKDGEIVVRIARGEHVRYALRVDSDEGEWLADTGNGRWLASQSKPALEKRLQIEATARRTVVWRRFIIVDYQSGAEYHILRGPADRRPREVKRIELDWEVEDYSDPFQVEGSTSPARRKKRGVRPIRYTEPEDDGTVRHGLYETLEEEEARLASDPEQQRDRRESWHHDDKLPAGALPYSHAALATLCKLRDMLGELDLAMCSLLCGTPEEVGARLASGNVPLLGSGE